MIQKEDEIFEDYVKIFQYNHQCFKIKLDKSTLKTLLLKEIREECTEPLNLMGCSDISGKKYDYICELCRIYSQ